MKILNDIFSWISTGWSRLQSSSTHVHACFFHPSTRCQSRCLFLVSLLPVCKFSHLSFAALKVSLRELKCFFVLGLLEGKFFTDQDEPILIELVGNHGKLWGTHTHTHSLSLPVLSLTSLNWREDWLQLESGIQSGIIKFDISPSTSTVSGVLSYERKLKYQSHLISIGLRI